MPAIELHLLSLNIFVTRKVVRNQNLKPYRLSNACVYIFVNAMQTKLFEGESENCHLYNQNG